MFYLRTARSHCPLYESGSVPVPAGISAARLPAADLSAAALPAADLSAADLSAARLSAARLPADLRSAEPRLYHAFSAARRTRL
ncbi:MAG: pentapeptide repeat-containing protein [Oscillospiraceae bacterium]|nr:pentapeptide repeat-containing protein [Oscillospiraceae bacterium]